MRRVLHILTRPEDALARAVIAHQKSLAETQIEVVDLNGPEPDYRELLEKIFASDSVQTW